MPTASVRLSQLVKDYLEFCKEYGENTSMDSAMREILDDADPDWREAAREYRQESDGPD